MKTIFITGGTGYIGRRLIDILLAKKYAVKALVRKGSEVKLPVGCEPVIGDPFDASTFSSAVSKGDIFIQLLGVAHPGPTKKELFRSIDLASVKASVAAAQKAGVSQFIYISVAQTPRKIMKDYQQCRAEGEETILSSGLRATFIRPWYVVGPGHYWPLIFQPFFKLFEVIPATSEKAKSMRLISLKQMLKTLMFVVKNPFPGTRIIEIQDIRRMR
jgi:uncharacterized protein YbjT (DUF2867 family)